MLNSILNIKLIFVFFFISFTCTAQKKQLEKAELNSEITNFETSEDIDQYKKKHNLEVNFGGMFHDDNEYFYYFFGLGYELRMYDFLGIDFSWNSGKLFLQENTVSGVDENRKYVFYGKQYFESKVNTFSVGPQFYLNLDDEFGFYLFAGFDVGVYLMNSSGRTETNNTESFGDKSEFPARFYSRLRFGTEVNVAKNVILSASIAGDNIDFENAAQGINWGVPWAKEIAPNFSVYLLGSFKVYW